MAGGRQLGALCMAELATVWRIDLVVANQAIRHLRQPAPIRPVGSLQPAVASLAGILRIECGPQLGPSRAQVSLLIDRGGNHRRQIAHLHMQLMIEPRETRRHRRSNLRRLVTLETDSLRRQQIVIQPRTVGSRRMANGATQLRRQMDPVRKRLGRLRNCRAGDRDQ